MMSFRVGTFTAPASTGTDSFDPGLPGVATALFLTSSFVEDVDTLVSSSRISHGATDGTNQWTSCAAVEFNNSTPVENTDIVMTGQVDDEHILRVIDHDGIIIAEAEFVSFNLDGTITLDWTTVDGTEFIVGYMAWDEVDAEAGVTTVSSTDSTVPVVTSIVPKFVLGSNATAINDGCVAMGWGNAPSAPLGSTGNTQSRGTWYAARANINDQFRVETITTAQRPLAFDQAATVGNATAEFGNFSPTGFDIEMHVTTVSFTDQPVGWLAIGGGGAWYVLPSFIGTDSPFVSLDLTPHGAVTEHYQEGANEERLNFTWGCWDETDSQWAALNYLEQSSNPQGVDNFAIDYRAFYDDRVNMAFTQQPTERGYQRLELAVGAHAPDVILTGTTPSPAPRIAYFVTQGTPAEGQERCWAWLV